MEAPKKKKNAGGLLLLLLIALGALLLGGKKDTTPPGPKAILQSVGDPDISPLGAIPQGGVKNFTWQCKNVGDGAGFALLQLDEVSPVPASALLIAPGVIIPAGQTVMLTLSGPVNLLPGDYVMRLKMSEGITVIGAQIDARTFALTISSPVPMAILTVGTLVIT